MPLSDAATRRARAGSTRASRRQSRSSYAEGNVLVTASFPQIEDLLGLGRMIGRELDSDLGQLIVAVAGITADIR